MKKNLYSNKIDFYCGILHSLEKRLERIPRNTQLRTEREREDCKNDILAEIQFYEKKIEKLARQWRKAESERQKCKEIQRSYRAYNDTLAEHWANIQYTYEAAMRPVSGGRCSPR